MENVYTNRMEAAHAVELIWETGEPPVRYHTYFYTPHQAVQGMAFLKPGDTWRMLKLPPQREPGS